MPVYEFFCPECRKKSSFLVRSASSFEPKCSKCGSPNVSRVISTFAYHKSITTIHEESGEPSRHPSADYYKDPRNIGRWAEKKFKDMGMEMPGEIQQKIQAAREGELPESVKDLQSASPDASYS
ncbi:MAG: zinc ribbon domain-containing protein [Chloroflexota bacterium]|nr:MAG: zinc ribbon domain-containing protein [Chloroflexota bacterium]